MTPGAVGRPRHHLLVCEPPTDTAWLLRLQHRYEELAPSAGYLKVRWAAAWCWCGRPLHRVSGPMDLAALEGYLERWLRPDVVEGLVSAELP